MPSEVKCTQTLVFGSNNRQSNGERVENFKDFIRLYNTGQLADCKLRLHDQTTGQHMLDIYSHKLILCSGADYFASLISNCRQLQASVIHCASEKIDLFAVYLDFSWLSAELIRDFFKLFYINVFDEEHLSTEEITYIVSNVLQLYQLADYFQFHALARFCEKNLFAEMNLGYFRLLTDYCVEEHSQCPLTGTRYHVPLNKLRLYSRLMQWYQCCVEMGDETTVGQQQDEKARPTRSQYHSSNKEQLLQCCAQRIANYEQCRVPERQVLAVKSPQMGRQIRYYRKICVDCLQRQSLQQQYIDMGLLQYGAAASNETYKFRLHQKSDNLFGVEMRFSASAAGAATEDMCVEIEGSEVSLNDGALYDLSAEVSLLSKRLDNEVCRRQMDGRPLQTVSEIGEFRLHERQMCYSGRCDGCEQRNQQLFILQMELLLQPHAEV